MAPVVQASGESREETQGEAGVPGLCVFKTIWRYRGKHAGFRNEMFA